jgi:hypothetical protein
MNDLDPAGYREHLTVEKDSVDHHWRIPRATPDATDQVH